MVAQTVKRGCVHRLCRQCPLADRVGDLLFLEEGKILWTLAILVAVMAGNRVHHVGEHVWLKTFILEVSFLQRYPFVQAGEVWHSMDQS